MPTLTRPKHDLEILVTSSPVDEQSTWRIEAFCLKILEYGDYSLRKALAGRLDSCLRSTFFTACRHGGIYAAAGCLYDEDNPAVAILGPVCTDPELRRTGLANYVCGRLLQHLSNQNTQAVYLGVKNNVPALNLYTKLGFLRHSGIVMRKLLVGEEEFHRRYAAGQPTIIRPIAWRDFAEVSALMCEPAGLYCFDYTGQIFSTRYAEAQRFLPVFPGLMNSLEHHGSGWVLTTEHLAIVGTAWVRNAPANLHNHRAVLDFFVLDGFLDRSLDLILETLKQSGREESKEVLCYCPRCDIGKKRILETLEAEPYAVLPDFIRIGYRLQDTLIYRLRRK